MSDDLWSATSHSGGNGDSGGHGFEDYVRGAFAEGRKHEDASHCQPGGDRGMKADKDDPILKRMTGDERAHTGKFGAIADENGAPASRPLGSKFCKGFYENGMAFFAGESADSKKNGVL